MENLDYYRIKIDELDKEITRLFEERMDTVIKIANYKKDNDLPIFNRDREDEVIEKNVGYLKNNDYSEETRKFFISLMEVSRELQSRKMIEAEEVIEKKENVSETKSQKQGKVGFFGAPGSFCEEAMIKYFGPIENACACDEFEDVFIAVKNDEIKYGIVPIENSSTGAISQVYDLLYKYGFYIVGEECIKINQNLIGVKGTTIDTIKEIYSHPQPIQQSTEFLKNYSEWKLIPFHSTSVSAKLISDLNDTSKAVIGSVRCASLYNLEIIKENINNKSDNSTRFIIISKELETDSNCNKVSVVFSLEHKAGTLYKLLRHFAENNINMMKIESRPMEKGAWKYFLYIDFEGNIESQEVKTALKLIEQSSAYFKLIGTYVKTVNS